MELHTLTDPDAPGLMRRLRADGIRIGALSNTMRPRHVHQQVFARDGIDGLIDGAVYSSEIDWTKPHREQVLLAAMAAVGVSDPAACVFVGDRPYDDVYGAKQAGMRAVLDREQRRARLRRGRAGRRDAAWPSWRLWSRRGVMTDCSSEKNNHPKTNWRSTRITAISAMASSALTARPRS